ncbi:MAG: hypothetical protein R2911_03510 [Caldilineaceae bacterium]
MSFIISMLTGGIAGLLTGKILQGKENNSLENLAIGLGSSALGLMILCTGCWLLDLGAIGVTTKLAVSLFSAALLTTTMHTL